MLKFVLDKLENKNGKAFAPFPIMFCRCSPTGHQKLGLFGKGLTPYHIIEGLNSIPNKFLDWTKFKALADDNLNVA